MSCSSSSSPRSIRSFPLLQALRQPSARDSELLAHDASGFHHGSEPPGIFPAPATTAPSMNPRPQYLIRLDDFCPTMLQHRRERFLSILARHGVSPILAVVPDNQDADLNRQASDPEFWDRMRSLQAAG